MGVGSAVVEEVLDAEYRDNMVLDDAIMLAIKALAKALEGGIDASKVSIAVVSVEDKKFRALTKEEVSSYIERYRAEQSKRGS
jgi:proteasome alpha subunit